MTRPLTAAACFGAALAMGAGLGLLYGFLRPLRPRLTHLADLLFVLAAFWAWLYLGFAVCGGDIRLAYTAGLALGGFAWEMTVGRLLRPLFFGFWRIIGKIFHFTTRPVEKISKKFLKIAKKLLAFGKKWFTIEWSIHKRNKTPGGKENGEAQKEKISHCAAQKPPHYLGLHSGGSSGVRPGADHPARKHRKQQRPV